MARIVQLACARCGHREMYVVESTENANVGAESETALYDASIAAAMRPRRLESLPTSLPVGGIITPV